MRHWSHILWHIWFRVVRKIVWRNVIAFIYLHIGAIYGVYLTFTSTKFQTNIWLVSLILFGGFGVTAGAHRLWAHRTYKAKWPMRLLLMILQTIAFQNHIYEWVRDHRVHHKFTDTNADPHNAKRGFFFSHIGWLLVRKHPDVLKKGATIDMSDLENDPIVVWQRRLYLLLVPTICFLFPVWVPCYFWKETLFNSWYSTLTRYALTLNGTWLVNSAAHIWGVKPYDKNIGPTENKALPYWHSVRDGTITTMFSHGTTKPPNSATISSTSLPHLSISVLGWVWRMT